VLEKRLGSLPVIADFCRRLDIAGVVDGLCPIRDVALATHGQVIEVLIANRLTNPTAMVGICDWAKAWAVPEVYGIAASSLGDDRLARALDAVAENVDAIVGSVGAAAIEVFGIDVTRMHWDMTSISLFGSYENNDPDYPGPGWGHPKDRRPDLKQIQAGIAVSADGAIPVFHQVYDGGAGEVAQVIDAMHALQSLADTPGFLMVGDSKLLSYGNVTAMNDAAVQFLAPLAAARVPAGLFADIAVAATTAVDYIAQRDIGKPAGQRCAYRVTEDVMHLSGPRKTDRVHQIRRILVHSSANQSAARNARTLKLDKARTELDTLTRTAGTRHHPDTAAVTAKAAQISRHRRIGTYLHTSITTHPDTGKPVFTWHYNQDAIDAEAADDGWYALLTNLSPADADPAEILRRYKGQSTVEQRYATIKGPLAVAPIFLQSNRRITALISVICLALLVFSLIEREVRARLAEQGQNDMTGFYAFDNRAVRPTAQRILHALNDLRLLPAHDRQPPKIPQPGWLQAQLLALLEVDPTRPRWL
jgi:transposase